MFNPDGSIQEIAIVRNYELRILSHITFGLSVDIWKHSDFNGKDVSYFWSPHLKNWQVFEKYYHESDEIYSHFEPCLVELLAHARSHEIKEAISAEMGRANDYDDYICQIEEYERYLI